MRHLLVSLILIGVLVPVAAAQNQREQAVRGDRQSLAEDPNWVYDDLDEAILAAGQSQRPLMVLIRCLP